ncbi:MAG: site-specific integrase [Ruminococcus sp.]|nr:site-specific integrase [Ruminococcus sp.]
MANITPRKNKDGKITSVTIRVYHGYDSEGNRLKPYTMSWKPEREMSEKQIMKEANRRAALFEEECKNGNISSAHNMKLRDFCNIYLDIKSGILSPRTYEYYTRVINDLIIPLLGHIRITDLKPAHVQQFIKYIQDNSEKKPSPSTIKRKVAILQSILRQAVKLGLIQTNPANAERLTMPKQIAPQVEIFTRQEAVEMLSCLEDEPLQYKVIVYLAIMSGAREGELVGLKFSDVDFINHRITIERSAYKLTGQPVQTKPPKDSDVRTVKVDEYTIDLIRQLKAEKERERFRLGTAWQGDEWLFTKWDGSIMFPSTPSHWFRSFLKRHGLKHRKFHALRHTSATLLLLAGTNVKQVSGRLGHADLRVTNQYLHCIAEADEAAANALGNMLITQHKCPDEQESIKKTG